MPGLGFRSHRFVVHSAVLLNVTAVTPSLPTFITTGRSKC